MHHAARTLQVRRESEPGEAVSPSGNNSGALNYRDWLGEAGWARLTAEVQQRFTAPGNTAAPVLYVGNMVVKHSWFGWLLAMLCRLIGTPLATGNGDAVPIKVDVRPDNRGGMLWSRYYSFRPGRWQRVRSTKRLSHQHGLEEVISGVMCMALELAERDGGLVFTSSAYSIAVGRWRLPIPAWLTPGETVVTHEPVDAEHFRFTLKITHRWLGQLVWQDGVFHRQD